MRFSNVIALVVGAVAGGAAGYFFAKKKTAAEADARVTEQLKSLEEAFEQKNKDMDILVEEKARVMAMELHLGEQRSPTDEECENPTHPGFETYELIGPDEFGMEDDYDEVMMTWYADDILVYDTDQRIVEDRDIVIGPNTLKHMGEFEPDIIAVRNHRYRTDYEISRSRKNFFPEERGE